jgi:hypothetical protein
VVFDKWVITSKAEGFNGIFKKYVKGSSPFELRGQW